MNKVRCAIYTRKSSEEGLEQDFNSLHAQREACSAYVLSQASEGWSLLPEEYDDGGLSGGTLARPALQHLLSDIEAGKIDIVVVYKVDRLTRSLLDFSKLVEAFDKANTSFVSVTQSFNTTTSMGRLTLNMLLSFAQFEREVTAERIRDKIAASKAKGMWMGGNPPLGYRPDGRTLSIVDEHAELIRTLFRRYLETGNVRLLAELLDVERIRVPERTASTGRQLGGGKFSRGQLYKILSNPIYLGEIHHKGKAYEGRHEAIIDRRNWDQVQAMLADNSRGEQRTTTRRSTSLLAGRVFDKAGEPLVASHACKGKVRYRYYVSRSLQHDDPGSSGIRVPALELEKAVAEELGRRFADPLALASQCGLAISFREIRRLSARAEEVSLQLRMRHKELLGQLIDAVYIHEQRVDIKMPVSAIAEILALEMSEPPDTRSTISLDVRLARTGRSMRLIQSCGVAAVPDPEVHLAKLLARANSWWRELCASDITAAELARRHHVTRSYVSRVLRLNFLAPEIVDAILSGSQPAVLDAGTLLSLRELPLSWDEQVRHVHMR